MCVCLVCVCVSMCVCRLSVCPLVTVPACLPVCACVRALNNACLPRPSSSHFASRFYEPTRDYTTTGRRGCRGADAPNKQGKQNKARRRVGGGMSQPAGPSPGPPAASLYWLPLCDNESITHRTIATYITKVATQSIKGVTIQKQSKRGG